MVNESSQLRSKSPAKLRYVRDDTPGITRQRAGDGFCYQDASGRRIRSRTVLDRVRKLAIPPAWEHVWICPHANGHLQATGRDARGRKQYRYHADWVAVRGDRKYARLLAFGLALAGVRRTVRADLARDGLPREKVLAAVVQLLDRTHLRVGNPEYHRANGTFGLSTLLDRHVHFNDGGMRVRFRGKGGIWHDRAVSDRTLAKVVSRCRDLPGQELFQYRAATGRTRTVGSADVNAYIRELTGGDFTAKDFRTWAGTVAATAALTAQPKPAWAAAADRAVVAAVRAVAAELGNTPAVCRKCYIHPAVMDAFRSGAWPAKVSRHPRLSADESRTLALLRNAGSGSRARRNRASHHHVGNGRQSRPA